MRQVTGSNPSRPINKVSIRLASDGHSFSVVGAEALRGAEPVEAEVLTPLTLLTPAALYDGSNGAALLAAAGLPPREGDAVVGSDPVGNDDPLVAVMALPAGALRAFGMPVPEEGDAAARPATCGGVRFTSPLLRPVPDADRCVWLYPTAGLLYIKVYDGGLRLAEVIPAPAADDALCLLDRLSGVWPLGEFTLRLAGAEAAAWRKSFKRRFKRIVCES